MSAKLSAFLQSRQSLYGPFPDTDAVPERLIISQYVEAVAEISGGRLSQDLQGLPVAQTFACNNHPRIPE